MYIYITINIGQLRLLLLLPILQKTKTNSVHDNIYCLRPTRKYARVNDCVI